MTLELAARRFVMVKLRPVARNLNVATSYTVAQPEPTQTIDALTVLLAAYGRGSVTSAPPDDESGGLVRVSLDGAAGSHSAKFPVPNGYIGVKPIGATPASLITIGDAAFGAINHIDSRPSGSSQTISSIRSPFRSTDA